MFPIDVYGKNKAIKMIEYMHQSNPRGDKASTAVAYECRFTEPTRHFDKHPNAFCSGKENICLAPHAVEQHFHILFTSSQEVRQFLQNEKRG